MAYRDDVDALAARKAGLEHELATKQRELAQASQLLDDARARASLPILDNIRVASPCKASWAEMTGDERVRHCGDCKKDVYNLSGMTREQAHELLAARNDLCVRYYQRTDGTILLADCEVGHRRKLRKNLIVAGAAVASLATATGVGVHVLSSSCHDKPEVMMGTLAVEPTHVISPERLTTSMIDRAMKPALPEIQTCTTSYSTNDVIRARVVVRGDGLVSAVSLVDRPDDALASCVGRHIQQLHFDPTRDGGTFIYPLTFRH